MCLWPCRKALSSEIYFRNGKRNKADYEENGSQDKNCRNRPGAEIKVTSSPESECCRAQKWRCCVFGSTARAPPWSWNKLGGSKKRRHCPGSCPTLRVHTERRQTRALQTWSWRWFPDLPHPKILPPRFWALNYGYLNVFSKPDPSIGLSLLNPSKPVSTSSSLTLDPSLGIHVPGIPCPFSEFQRWILHLTLKLESFFTASSLRAFASSPQ